MGKQKFTQATDTNNTEQRERSSTSPPHSKHSERRKSSGTRPIIYKFEELASVQQHEGRAFSPPMSRKEEITQKYEQENSSRRSSEKSSSHRRSKSLSSMRQKSKRQKSDSLSKRPAVNTTVSEGNRGRLQKVASVDKPEYCPLKPILKHKPAIPEIWLKQDLTHQDRRQRTPSRNVSITSMEDDKDVRAKRKDGYLQKSESLGKKVPPLHQVTSKKSYKDTDSKALVQPNADSRKINSSNATNDIQNIASSNITSTHILLVHPDNDGHLNDMDDNDYHKCQVPQSTDGHSSAETPSSWKPNSQPEYSKLNIPKSGYNNYREIWIGGLVDKRPTSQETLRNSGIVDISFPVTVTEPNIVSKSQTSGNTRIPTCCNNEESLDLIDLSTELPSPHCHDPSVAMLKLNQQSDLELAPVEYCSLPLESGDSLISDLLEVNTRIGNDSLSSADDSGQPNNIKLDPLSPDLPQGDNLNKPSLECKMTALSEEAVRQDCNPGVNNNNSNSKPIEQCPEVGVVCDSDNANPLIDSCGADQSTTYQPVNIPEEDNGKNIDGETQSLGRLTGMYNADDFIPTSEQFSKEGMRPGNIAEAVIDSDLNNGYQPVVLPPPCLFGDPIVESVSVDSHGNFSSKIGIRTLSRAMSDCANTTTDTEAEDCSNLDLKANQTANRSSTDLSSPQVKDYSEVSQKPTSLQSALHRVMRDVTTVAYWDTSDNNGEGYSDSDSLQSGTLSPRQPNQLKTTAYNGRLSESDSTVSNEQVDSEDSTASKKRVTISTTNRISRRRHSEKITFNHQSKGILKKSAYPPISDAFLNNDDVKTTQNGNELPMKRSHLISDLNDEAPQLRVATEWYVSPPQAKLTEKNLRIDYLDLPRLELPKRPQKPISQSLELEEGITNDSTSECDTGYEREQSCHFEDTTPLPHGVTPTLTQQTPSRRESITGRFNKMFAKKRSKSVKVTSTSLTDKLDWDVTVSTLYSEWLDDSAEKLPIRRRGEGLRTVVLARTKKGFGFVLRGAKAEQLRKLNVQFVPSEKMPALQYLDSVEKGSVSDKAGLRAGDFILEIDRINVVHASHEQTVQIIKKAGDVLAMKVVRAVLTNGDGGKPTANGAVNGSLTLPHRKPAKEDPAVGSSSEVLTRKHIPESSNGQPTDEERLVIDQLDATLANYDSDSRSSGSGAVPPVVTFREPKTASIRQRPSSSHFNSIQELDDMFSAPGPAQPSAAPSLPAPLDKNDTRKPAKSRVKKFWNKGKTNNKLSSNNKHLSLSQPNLASLDRDAEVQPITMYEMSLGHSIDAEGHVTNSVPRTFSGDLSSLRRKSESMGGVKTSIMTTSLPPPPPTYPAPLVPDDDESSQISSNSIGSRSASSFGNAVTSNNGTATPSTQYPVLSQSNSFTKLSPTNQVLTATSFSDAIKKAAAEREITDKSANNNSVPAAVNGDDIYAVIQKKPVKTRNDDPPRGSVVSVEDQLKLAIAKRRTLIDKQEPSTESDRSHSATPEKTLSPSAGDLDLAKTAENTNFIQLAEQKRQEFLKKKADSRDRLLPPVPNQKSAPADDSGEDSLSELKKVMSRLSVAKADEPNNNIKKKPPPVTLKKPGKALPQANTHDHLSPVEEFPPPPPPHDFGGSNGATDIIIPPPSFEVAPSQAVYSPQSLSPTSYTNNKPADPLHQHDADCHSVTSSVGSDTISSVSQDGNRLSVATSGYSSDPSRSTKLSFSGKNVELWSADEVGEWLEALGLGEYKATFAENCIEGETLISMSKVDVKELGVEKVGHRVKLDKEIRKLVAESNT